MARAMQRYVDEFDHVPVLVLPALVRYREPTPFEGASVYPACQNLLLAARALGYGGVLTGWHYAVEAQLKELLGVPEEIFLAATITIGKPAGHHGPVRRRPIARAGLRRAVGTCSRLGGGPARCGAHAGGTSAPVDGVDLRSRA